MSNSTNRGSNLPHWALTRLRNRPVSYRPAAMPCRSSLLARLQAHQDCSWRSWLTAAAVAGLPPAGTARTGGFADFLGGRREGPLMMSGAEQHRAASGTPRLTLSPHCQICGRDFGFRRDMPQIDADAFYDAMFERVFVDRNPTPGEMPGRVDVGAPVVGH